MEKMFMLVIRQEQRDVFNDVNDIEFIKRLKEILRDKYPEESYEYNDESLEEMIRQGFYRARKDYGMRWETALGDFCGLKLQLGEHFDEEPQIHYYLTEESVPPDQRINRMFAQIPEKDWNRICQNIDEIETANSAELGYKVVAR